MAPEYGRIDREQGSAVTPVQAVLGVAGSLAGLGVYVYLLGGFVVWLKLTAARLPTDDAVKALDSNLLLAVGMKALVFELVVVGLLWLLAIGSWEFVRIKEARAATKKEKKASELELASEESSDSGQKEQAKQAREDATRAATDAKALEAGQKLDVVRMLLQFLVVSILGAALTAGAFQVVAPQSPSKVAWSIAIGINAGFAWLIALDGLGRWMNGGSVEEAASWQALGEVPFGYRPFVWLGIRIMLAVPLIIERVWGATWTAADRRRILKTWLTIVAALIAFFLLAAPAGVGILVLLLFVQLSHKLNELPTVSKPVNLIPSVLIVAAGLSLVVATYLATPPVALKEALVALKDGHHVIRGGYIGQTGDGVYLASCAPKDDDPEASEAATLRLVTSDRVRRVVVSGNSDYILDDGRNFSLFDAGTNLLSQGAPSELTDAVSIDFRSDELTCGTPQHLDLGRRRRDPGSGLPEQTVSVPASGFVVLAGEGLRPQKKWLSGAGVTSLPVQLNRLSWHLHRCEGPFTVRYGVVFRHGDEPPEGEDAEATVSSPGGASRAEKLRQCHRAYVHQNEAMLIPPTRAERADHRANAR